MSSGFYRKFHNYSYNYHRLLSMNNLGIRKNPRNRDYF